MSKDTNGRAAVNGAKKNENTNAGTPGWVARWRRHVADAIDRRGGEPDAAKHGLDVPPKWMEEVEGRPMADVVTDWLCAKRGIGAERPTPEQEVNLMVDEHYETEGTVRGRNAHERETAVFAVMSHLANHTRLPVGEDLHDLVRLFYRRGDCGIDDAVVRAIRYAVAKEREARADG